MSPFRVICAILDADKTLSVEESIKVLESVIRWQKIRLAQRERRKRLVA